MSNIILEATNVTKRFGGLTAVDKFDFDLPTGSIISIIGPNGAGKTTFFNCITGFYDFDEGDILFAGRSTKGRSPDKITRMGIARTYQNIRLFAQMTAIENILVGMEPSLRSNWIGALSLCPFPLHNSFMEQITCLPPWSSMYLIRMI